MDTVSKEPFLLLLWRYIHTVHDFQWKGKDSAAEVKDNEHSEMKCNHKPVPSSLPMAPHIQNQATEQE